MRPPLFLLLLTSKIVIMKIKISTLIVIISLILNGLISYSQCDPMTPEECPDPENNGEICPDTLEIGYLTQYYSQVATIKPPSVYYLPPDSTEINLHHVKLMEVGNLPPGLTWTSNSADSVFMAGEYYCVLMEGTPDSAGVFPLRITVDVYVLVFGVPVRVATVTDSTSLSIVVIDDTGIGESYNRNVTSLQNVPNPFCSETAITYFADGESTGTFEVFTIQGKRIHSEKILSEKGDNILVYSGMNLVPGMYFYMVRFEGYLATGIMIRSDR